MIILLGLTALSSAAALPVAVHPTGSQRRALQAAGCELRAFPNPTGKIVAPPPSVICSPEARAALDGATREAAAIKVAGKE